MTRRDDAIKLLRPFVEKARDFSGWSFHDLDVRDLDPTEPWDYVAVAREFAASAGGVIDFGTGGGEMYSKIVAGIDAHFVASEEWDVNAAVAQRRLQPLAVDVVRGQSERPAFRDATFGLALSRHEAIEPKEVARILRPGGVFVTQQVAKEHWQEIREFFPRKTVWPDHFVEYRRDLEAAGCDIVRTGYHTWRRAYATIGEIAFMLMVAVWEIPGFDPVAEIDSLLALADRRGDERGIVLTNALYLIVARKP